MAKKDITGAVGAVPPPDAPIENAAPLKPETIEFQRERASQNEKTLAPFKPGPAPRATQVPAVAAAPPAPVAATVAPSATDDLIADVFGTDKSEPVAAVPSPSSIAAIDHIVDKMQAEIDQLSDVMPELTAEDRLRMPAASNTDTPAKGLLPDLTPPKGDKFDGIQRGGFSDLADAQYFPLNGEELRELVLALFDDMADRLKNDLRFSIALTYPRVRAVVKVEVEGHAEDNNSGFEIRKVLLRKEGENGGTALEVARTLADQVCFVVEATRREFSPDGDSEFPPDAIRDELGLPKPRKQIVRSGIGLQGESFVDEAPGGDVAAITR